MRESKKVDESILASMFEILKNDYSSDWLLSLEIIEISKSEELKTVINCHLQSIIENKPLLKKLIEEGLGLV